MKKFPFLWLFFCFFFSCNSSGGKISTWKVMCSSSSHSCTAAHLRSTALQGLGAVRKGIKERKFCSAICSCMPGWGHYTLSCPSNYIVSKTLFKNMNFLNKQVVVWCSDLVGFFVRYGGEEGHYFVCFLKMACLRTSQGSEQPFSYTE